MYEKIAPYYKYIFPSSNVQREFFRRLFEEHRVESVLDAACGSGEQLEAFAEMGLKAHGLELEETMVEIIKRKPSHKADKITVKAGDMLKAAELFPGPYGAVICVGNSLVHLKDREKISRAIVSWAKTLEPGGLIIIQIVNYDRILDQNITSLPTIETKDDDGNPIAFHRDYDMSGLPGVIRFNTRLKVKGEETAGSVPLVPLRSEQLLDAAGKAGFIKSHLFGGYDFSPFSPDSQGCILTAEKQNT
jgi:SAM-dependent methyltransferase